MKTFFKTLSKKVKSPSGEKLCTNLFYGFVLAFCLLMILLTQK